MSRFCVSFCCPPASGLFSSGYGGRNGSCGNVRTKDSPATSHNETPAYPLTPYVRTDISAAARVRTCLPSQPAAGACAGRLPILGPGGFMIADGSAPTRPLVLSTALLRDSRISKRMPRQSLDRTSFHSLSVARPYSNLCDVRGAEPYDATTRKDCLSRRVGDDA